MISAPVVHLALAFASSALAVNANCAPIPIALPRVTVAYAGADFTSAPARTLVIIESDQGNRRHSWPWKYFDSIELIPNKGPVLTDEHPTIETPSDVRRYIANAAPDSSYGVFSFRPAIKGESFRIVLDLRDPSVPEGCTPIELRSVIGSFIVN